VKSLIKTNQKVSFDEMIQNVWEWKPVLGIIEGLDVNPEFLDEARTFNLISDEQRVSKQSNLYW